MRDKMMVNTGMIRMVKMSTILIVFYSNPPGPGARDGERDQLPKREQHKDRNQREKKKHSNYVEESRNVSTMKVSRS